MAEYVIDLSGVEVKTIKETHGIETIEALWGLPVRERIVRCRDCEYARIMRPLDWRTGKPSTVIEEWYCQWHSNAEGASDIEPDGFCAWGERKEVHA